MHSIYMYIHTYIYTYTIQPETLAVVVEIDKLIYSACLYVCTQLPNLNPPIPFIGTQLQHSNISSYIVYSSFITLSTRGCARRKCVTGSGPGCACKIIKEKNKIRLVNFTLLCVGETRERERETSL